MVPTFTDKRLQDWRPALPLSLVTGTSRATNAEPRRDLINSTPKRWLMPESHSVPRADESDDSLLSALPICRNSGTYCSDNGYGVNLDVGVHPDHRPPARYRFGNLVVPQFLVSAEGVEMARSAVPLRRRYRSRATSRSQRQKTSTTRPGRRPSSPAAQVR